MVIHNAKQVFSALLAGLAFSICAYAQSSVDEAVGIARNYFRANAANYGLTDSDRELTVRSARAATKGYVIRFDQNYRGVPVFEGEAIAHVANGGVTVTNALRPNLAVDTRPVVTSQAAVVTAVRAIGARGSADTTSALEILPKGSRSALDFLVWHVKVMLENDVDQPTKWDYLIDAHTGLVLWSFNSLETAGVTVTGKTMYSGDVTLNASRGGFLYTLVDPTRGSGNATDDMHGRTSGKGTVVSSTKAVFGDNSINNTDPDTAGADAAFGVSATWDYYLNMFARNGIDNNGRKTYSRVHYSRGYDNAFWDDSCFCMTYGDGQIYFYPLVAIDITGHELSHGVMSAEANLTYAGEPGGLNESNSDIFGTMVEFAVNNAFDTPEWWIGERSWRANWVNGQYVQTAALRYMENPPKDGKSPACWSSGIGGLDVHYSSGPNNHMFYLLAHGGTSVCNGQLVTGIGNDKSARIWYEAISNWMNSNTDYHGARTACLSAATTLYGAGSAEYNAVAAAYAAINVN
ncbi:MAG: peptidase M4 family protein [Terriglobia bacterium]|nr:MAG: peptidase M4 family protein [Terriglobia bacterium]